MEPRGLSVNQLTIGRRARKFAAESVKLVSADQLGQLVAMEMKKRMALGDDEDGDDDDDGDGDDDDEDEVRRGKAVSYACKWAANRMDTLGFCAKSKPLQAD